MSLNHTHTQTQTHNLNHNLNLNHNNNNNNLVRIAGNASNGTTQACAACKYQRRKCAPDCVLAPYFPHDRQRQFLNAHKLFGVSNITKLIKNIDSLEHKDTAMRTIIFQSDVRATDPVGGCYRIIRDLQHQIEYTKAELDIVLHQLALCRAQAQAQAQAAAHHQHNMLLQHELVSCESIAVNNNHNNEDDPLSSYNSMGPAFDQQDGGEEEQYVVNNNNNNNNNSNDNSNSNNNNNVDDHGLQEDIINITWGIQDSNMLLSSDDYKHNDDEDDDDVKPILEIPNIERHDMKFEDEDLVEKRFVPSTQLMISS